MPPKREVQEGLLRGASGMRGVRFTLESRTQLPVAGGAENEYAACKPQSMLE